MKVSATTAIESVSIYLSSTEAYRLKSDLEQLKRVVTEYILGKELLKLENHLTKLLRSKPYLTFSEDGEETTE